jgi:hypothetical protein
MPLYDVAWFLSTKENASCSTSNKIMTSRTSDLILVGLTQMGLYFKTLSNTVVR